VPVRAELLSQTLDFQRRMLACFSKGVEQRRRHLAQLARVLPRADQLFAAPRQRLDQAGDGLQKSLRRNVQEHRTRFHKAESLLRPRILADRIALGRERTGALAERAKRAQTAEIARARKHLESLTRVLESISYRAVLERGFALVKGEDGKVRRRAGDIKAGEGLTLTFADGEALVQSTGAVAGGKAAPRGKKSPTDQGSLF